MVWTKAVIVTTSLAVLSLGAMNCATTPPVYAFPKRIALTVIVEDDVGPRVSIYPSANSNGIAQMFENKRRAKIMAKAPSRLNRALGPSALAAFVTKTLVDMPDHALPFRWMPSATDATSPRFYVVVDSYGMRAASAATAPVVGFLDARAQLRENGRVTWKTDMSIKLPLSTLRRAGVRMKEQGAQNLMTLSEDDLGRGLKMLGSEMVHALTGQLNRSSKEAF